MAIAFRAEAHATRAQGVGANEVVITKPTGTVDDDAMVLVVWTSLNTVITLPAGWTGITGSPFTDGTNFWRMAVATKKAASEGASYTTTFGDDVDAVGAILSYSGVDTTTLLDVVGAITADTTEITSHVASAATTTTANAMLVAIYGGSWADTTPGWTPPASMSERVDHSTGAAANVGNLHVADVEQAVAGSSGTKTATSAETMNSLNILIALKAAAAAAKPVPIMAYKILN